MFFMKEILHYTWTITPLGHTLSLNKIHFAHITIIVKWKFSENVCMAGWLFTYQGVLVSELRLLSAVLAKIKVLVVVVACAVVVYGYPATIKQ